MLIDVANAIQAILSNTHIPTIAFELSFIWVSSIPRFDFKSKYKPDHINIIKFIYQLIINGQDSLALRQIKKFAIHITEAAINHNITPFSIHNLVLNCILFKVTKSNHIIKVAINHIWIKLIFSPIIHEAKKHEIGISADQTGSITAIFHFFRASKSSNEAINRIIEDHVKIINVLNEPKIDHISW